MAERIVGIYGFDFIHPFAVGDIDFVPLFGYPESRDRARDPDSFQLTGYGRFSDTANRSDADMDAIRLITDGMTFIQQQHVLASVLVDMSPGDSVEEFVNTEAFRRPFPAATSRHTFGELVLSDMWNRDSRSTFLNAFVKRFAVEQADDPLRRAFFRQIEISRLATPFVELHHFLAFSALELLARSRGPNRHHRNAAVPITDLLNEQGFPIEHVEVARWTRARNAAFHRGELTTPDLRGGPDIRLADQLLTISNVLADALLKLLPFDDGRINWNRWRDRMAFR